MRRAARVSPVVSFDWWDDAVDVARIRAAQTGVRQRVTYVGGPRPWRVLPSFPRALEVTC